MSYLNLFQPSPYAFNANMQNGEKKKKALSGTEASVWLVPNAGSAGERQSTDPRADRQPLKNPTH